MNVRARKVVRDLLSSRARTVLVVLALAIGLAGLSTTIRARAIFTSNLDRELAAVNPSSATILTTGADDATVAAIRGREDVAEAEGKSVSFGRIVVGEGRRPLRLMAVDDPGAAAVDRLRPERGSWPPSPGTLALERSSVEAAGLGIGDIATIVDPAGTIHRLRVSATVHDLGVVSGRLVDQVVFAYAGISTLEQLGFGSGFDEIAFTVATDRLDEEHIRAVAHEVAGQVAGAGLPVLGIRIPRPGTHILENVIASLLLVLGSLGALSLVLSGFLIFNTVSATIARQRAQIGVMKAIGASRRDILVIFLGAVAVHSALALIVAVPAGALAASVLTQRLGDLLNIDIVRLSAPPWVWVVEVTVGLVVPAAAAFGPILIGARITVAEAIRTAETPATFGTGRVDRAVARLQRLPAALRYAARNTFRRKLRLALTVVALSLGGAILVTVLTLRSSLLATVDSIAAYWMQDVTVDLARPMPLAPLEEAVASIPGAAGVEGWLITPGHVVDSDGRDAGEEVSVFGVPATSAFIHPTLVDGRWLEAGDSTSMVVNVDVEPAVSVGDEMTLRIGGKDTVWRVVGISTTQLIAPGEPRPSAPIAYVPDDVLQGTLGAAGMVNRLSVAGISHDPSAQEALADEIDRRLGHAGVGIGSVETRTRMLSQLRRLTAPILVLLVAMAVLFALVGGLGLLGTMSLNVLERTQEIGMLRAIGATDATVRSIVLVEGFSVAALSWLAGSAMAVPLGWAMARAVGVSFIHVPLDFRFSPLGVLTWLGVAAVVAFVSSSVPARHASRLNVRDAIAYE